MKKPQLNNAAKKDLGEPPSLDESQNAPETIARKAPNAKGRGDQINFPCSPELRREIKMFCAELGIKQTDYLEKIHRYYYAQYKGGKI
ncbi:hypothetical protein EU642_22230 [Salmonella enterica]|nr:hypothetical protein [Salmonella enterica]EAO0118573.1 hypothetical protein [Salmonella enterica]EAO3601676.1 hypothetical protein [Salmonella enterica]EAR6391571.1 hypothetical protein [Salmonella enterica]EAV1285335.1 hypothetical protein [Salmonella enterica]